MEEIGDGVALTLLATKMTIENIARARTTITSKALDLGLDHIRDLLIPRDFFTPAVHKK
jgi:hypothetical protein